MSFVKEFRAARYLHQNGRIMEALAAYLDLILKQPEDPELLFLTGAAEMQLGQLDAGIGHLEKSLAINPDQPLALSNLGMALQSKGRLADSLAVLEKALKMAPYNPGVHFNRANTLHALGRNDDAILGYARTIELAPDFAPAHNNSGNLLQSIGKTDAAYKCFTAAIARSPHFAEAYNNRGNLLRRMEKRREALADFDKAIECNANFAEAYYNKGNVLLDLRQFGAALASLTRALSIRPDYPEALDSKGVALRALGRAPEALPFLDKALELAPDYAEAHNNRGIVRQNVGDHRGAEEDFRAALALMPDYPQAEWNLSLVTLLKGDFKKGWDLFESRWTGSQMRHFKRAFPQPLWQGEDISGKSILLYAEQGFGDTLQFCRYVPKVAALGAKVVLEVQPELKRLLTGLCPQAQLIAKGEDLPETDYVCPLMSLPRAFNTDLETIPGDAPYLSVAPDLVHAWAEKLGSAEKKRVGLVISGSRGLTPDLTRSIPAKTFAPLFDQPAEFHLLQKDIREADAKVLEAYPQLVTHREDLTDFAETAALIENLDLVITVDTAVAHLAGALGKPVWLLIPVSPDWRWLTDREDSPWYPAMRIFRQTAYGDWSDVIAAVGKALTA